MGALDARPLYLSCLPRDCAAFLGGVVFGDRLGPNLVQPDITELAVGLFRLEANGEVGRLVGRGAHQHAIIVNLVAERHFLPMTSAFFTQMHVVE